MLISQYPFSSPLLSYGKTEKKTDITSQNEQQTTDTIVREDAVSLSEKGKNLSQNKTDIQNELTEAEFKELQSLKKRDQEVRTHEQAHLAAAGGHARGGPSFTLAKGPDGNSYAVAGEVSIDMSEERTPEQTAYKMQVIQRAALAPASPSSTDKRVAAQAAAKAQQAKIEIAAKQRQSADQPTDDVTTDDATTPSETATSTQQPIQKSSDSSHSTRLMVNAYSAQQHTHVSHSFPAA